MRPRRGTRARRGLSAGRFFAMFWRMHKAILISCLLLLNGHASAKKFYKYTDENGITHYFDRPPDTEHEVNSWQVRVEDSELKITVVNRGTQELPVLYAVNEYNGPVEVRIQLSAEENIQAEPPLPLSVVIPARGDQFVTRIKPRDAKKSWAYQYSIEFTLGDPSATHASDVVYALPFRPGQTHYVSQGFNGQATHATGHNEFAIDIVMPEGTEILAARSGVVMDIADDFFGGGIKSSNLRRANFIRILHEDGSMAVYAHLLLESVRVYPGQKVRQGELIARSGNTGFSSGPHLHFVVQLNQSGTLKSVPFMFKSHSGGVFVPSVGSIQ